MRKFIKRQLLLLTVLVMIFSFFNFDSYAASNTRVEEWFSIMQDQYIDKKGVDDVHLNLSSGYGQYQCTQMAWHYSKYLFDVDFAPSIINGNAGAMYADADPAYFTKIKNGPGIKAKRGDIIIWKNGGAGHVAIVESASGNDVTVIEQNVDAPYKGLGQIVRRRLKKNYQMYYNKVTAYGWLRPRPEKIVAPSGYNAPKPFDLGSKRLVRIKNISSNLALSLDGSNVKLKNPSNNDSRQVWEISKYNDDKYYSVKNASNLKVLHASNNVNTTSWSSSASQLWQFLGSKDEAIIKPKSTTDVLDGGSNESNSNVVVAEDNDSSSQKFKIEYLDSPKLDLGISKQGNNVTFSWNDVGEDYIHELVIYKNGSMLNYYRVDGLSKTVSLQAGNYSARVKGYKKYISGGVYSPSKTLKFKLGNKKLRLTEMVAIKDAAKGSNLGYLSRNTVVNTKGYVEDYNGVKWYVFDYNGSAGYVCALSTSTDLTPEDQFVIRTTKDLKVYNSSFSKIGNLKHNTLKTVYGYKKDKSGNTWYKIWFNNSSAYIKQSETSKDLKFNVRISDKVKVRRTPNGETIGYLYKNKIKTVYSYTTQSSGGKIYKIWYKGHYRYIHSYYTDDKLDKVDNYNVQTTTTLNVRKWPWGPKVGTLAKGRVKTVYAQRKDENNSVWFRVWFNGSAAYISGNYTKEPDRDVRITDDVNVRKSPWGSVVGGLSKNDVTTVYGSKKDSEGVDWYKVDLNGTEGYIYSLLTDENLKPVSNFNAKTKVTLNVRKKPWGSVLGTLSKGEIRTVYAQRKDKNGKVWYKIEYNNSNGYISADHVTKIEIENKIRTTDLVNIRKSPWGTSLGYLSKNKIKSIYSTKEDIEGVEWHKIDFNGGYGYVYSLATDTNLTSTPDFDIKTDVALNVRNKPWGDVRGTLSEGTIKTVYGQRKDTQGDTWYRVYYNGEYGYLIAKHTTKIQSSGKIRITDKTEVKSSVNGSSKGYLYRNKTKSVYGTSKDSDGIDWYKVSYDNGYGYVSSLCTDEDLKPVYNFNVKVKTALKVREKPWGTQLGVLSKDTIKTVYGQRKDNNNKTWYRVWYNGGYGYVMGSFTTKQ